MIREWAMFTLAVACGVVIGALAIYGLDYLFFGVWHL